MKYHTLRETVWWALMFLAFELSAKALDEGGHGGNGGDPMEVARFQGRDGVTLDSWSTIRSA
jgi:hypothetical protein